MQLYYPHIERDFLRMSPLHQVECNHIWSDFYPVDTNGKLEKFCYRCKMKKGKKDIINERNERRARIKELAKIVLKHAHIDLWW